MNRIDLDHSSNAGKDKVFSDVLAPQAIAVDKEVETRVEQAGTPNKGVKKGRSSKKLIKWWETGQEEENVHVEGEDSAILLGKQQINEGVNVDADGYIRHEYPLRLDAENCAHYMRTGTCKYGLSCRFNHPMRRRRSQGTKDTSKQREEDVDKLWQVECKYYLTPGGCKHGSACRYSHSKGTTAAVPNVDLNFLGLPLRTGEKDCPYYMDTGSCKFGQNCRFNHPDRRLKGEGQPHSRPVNLQEMTSSWRPSAGSFNETVGAPPKVVREEYQGPIYTPSQLSLSLPPAMSHQSSNASFYLQHQQELLVEDFAEENEQAEAQNRVVPPMYTPLPRSLFLPAAMSPAASDFYLQLQQEMLVEEFQEQTGQPEPPYPRSRSPIDRSCALNEKGLPLRPGKDVCAYYNRYRLCKYGPACRFDHPGDVQSAR